MKRILLYIGILAALLAAPVERLDVGKLRPVQAVWVYKENEWLVIETDTGDIGIGETVGQALKNMEDTTSGVIYLDTADYLLLSEEAEDTAIELQKVLKPKTQMCYAESEIDIKEVGRFLAAHSRLPELKEWKKGQELPVITTFRKRLTFLKKVENNA